MNFKLIFLLFFLSACGLKTKPVAPAKTALPSIPDSYFTHPHTHMEHNEDDDKKK